MRSAVTLPLTARLGWLPVRVQRIDGFVEQFDRERHIAADRRFHDLAVLHAREFLVLQLKIQTAMPVGGVEQLLMKIEQPFRGAGQNDGGVELPVQQFPFTVGLAGG